MKKIILLTSVLWFSACADSPTDTGTKTASVTSTTSSLTDVLMDQTDGCQSGPMAQFGRYVGDWNIEDQSLSQEDGKTWSPGKGARWNFTCVGDGIAVQDFWMPNGGGKGTNLRIYNPETESWDIVWTATGAPGTMNINAKQQEGGEILMNILSPVQNPPRRIIFWPPTEDGWDWSMQMSFDGEKTWADVYKIKATPR